LVLQRITLLDNILETRILNDSHGQERYESAAERSDVPTWSGSAVSSQLWNLESAWNLEFGIWNLESGIWNLEFGTIEQWNNRTEQ
jgi:hypothetical protein